MKKYAKICVISFLCLTLLPAKAFFAVPQKPVPDIPVSLNPIDTAKAIAQQVSEAAQRIEEAIRQIPMLQKHRPLLFREKPSPGAPKMMWPCPQA